MKKIISTFLLLAFIISSSAQEQTQTQSAKKQYIKASVGYGISATYDDVDINAEGFYVQAEFVYEVASWFDIRPYAGFILTNTNDNVNESLGFKSNTTAFLLGGKVRFTAPIPWVSPYVEIGVGMSVGEFETITPLTNIKETGMILHIPFSIGLELGRKHNFDIAFTYYYHNAVEQFAGAAAVGVTFPLN